MKSMIQASKMMWTYDFSCSKVGIWSRKIAIAYGGLALPSEVRLSVQLSRKADDDVTQGDGLSHHVIYEQ